VALLLLVVNGACADHYVSLSAAGPGCSAGSIKVTGDVYLETGWALAGTGRTLTVSVWQNNSLVTAFNVPLTVDSSDPNHFTYTGYGDGSLTTGATYNVVVEADFVSSMCVAETYYTQPVTAAAS
jgi:hypothetical protein